MTACCFPVFQHPRFQEALVGLGSDPALARAFDAGRADPIKTSIWTSSSGYARTVQLSSLPWMLLVDGYRRVRAFGRSARLEAFVAEVLAALELARAAATGRCEVLAVVALRGGHLSPGETLSTADGDLTPLAPLQRELARRPAAAR